MSVTVFSQIKKAKLNRKILKNALKKRCKITTRNKFETQDIQMHGRNYFY